MPISITFYRLKERTPEHGEEIIYLSSSSTFDSYGFEPRLGLVEYAWDNGNGMSICYNGESDLQGFELVISFGEMLANDESLWCYPEEWWLALEE